MAVALIAAIETGEILSADNSGEQHGRDEEWCIPTWRLSLGHASRASLDYVMDLDDCTATV